jgi:UDP-glucose 4-epimerase
MSRGAVLVTGVGGLIGGATARRLAEMGRNVVAMDQAAPPGFPLPVITHDLSDPHRWHEVIVRHGVRKVVHAGGVSGPMLLQDQPARICEINLASLVALLEAARIHRLERIVWFSSIVAYGERADRGAVAEETPLAPSNVYGATKAAGEALIRAFHAEHGVDAVAFRVAGCYGPGRTTACVIRTLIEDGLAGRVTRVRDMGDRTRQHVFVEDVVDAICTALDGPALPQRVYNVGPGAAQGLDEIAAGVAAAVPGVAVELHPDGLSWNTFGLGPLDITAARRDLGFRPRTGLAEGAAHTRAWVEERTRA